MNPKDVIKDLKNLEDLNDFSNLNKDQELFRNKNKKLIGKFKIETAKKILIDEFTCLRNKAYSFEFGRDNKKFSKEFLKLNRNILILKNLKKV